MAALPTAAAAQGPARPYREWRTVETAHFRFHYPRDLERWTLATASHIESVDSAVAELVGFAPAHRVDVVVDDPFNQPNGAALPFLRAPVLTFWPVPPSPREDIGNWRTWGEMLSVHEFAHLAHLTRPSRNPVDAALWRLLPADLGPIPRKIPRWAIEGYATFVEGRITGSGRPNGAWRAAMLRQWALEGRLPTYDQMSDWRAFNGGDFAYLAGSAFYEWLAAREGDSSLVHVWRRASARVERGFDDAFAGVFGDPPRVLYGRFTAQLTAQAAAAAGALAAAGDVSGTLIQRLDWQTGDPALSPDGRQVALVLRSASAPPRLVIWSTAPPPPDTAAQQRIRRMLARDPQDVPARRFYPKPRQALFTLPAVGGRGYTEPRFMPGGRQVLVSRSTRQANGTLRPDLYLWTPAGGAVRRVTTNAAVSDADPAPDGRTALATRCTGGACAVVRVDLATGAVATVLPGDPARSYYRPRISPDGRRFVVSASDSGRWRLALAAVDGAGLRFIGPDDRANRYDAAFAGHDTLVYASDLGGVIDLAALDLRTDREWPLTRVTGAAVAPAPDPADGSIWFLSLHARGYDVRRLAGDSSAGAAVSIVGKYGAASPPEPLVRPRMPGNPVRGPLPYGLGARHTRWLPGESFGPDGFAAAAYVTNIDVIGRLDAIAGGSFGARPQWNGATFGAAWRGSRVVLEAGAHYARRDPRVGSAAGVAPVGLNATRAGGLVAASFDATGDQWRWRARTGVGAERLTLGDRPAPAARTLAFLEWSGAVQQSRGRRTIAEHLAVHADAGRTAGSGVRRIVASASLGETGVGPVPLVLSGTWGHMNGSTLAFERFSAGGLPSPLVDSSLAAAQYPIAGLPHGAIVPDAPGRASSLFLYRASIPLGGLTPYYEAVSIGTGAGPGAWHRLAGVEFAFATPPIPLGYLPGADVLLGVARSFDPPFAGRTTVYSGIRLVP